VKVENVESRRMVGLAKFGVGTRQNRRVSYLDLKREISQLCEEVLLVIFAAGFVPVFREKSVFLQWLLNIGNV